jgi:signal transduction histidine kinase
VVFEQSFKEHFRIKCAASGADALEVLRAEPVAVLITDQRMPGMSGHELLTLAKQVQPEAVRVVITAYSDIDPILRAVNEGLVARYIIKPWDRAELEQLLLWAIRAYDLGREDLAMQVRLMQTERLATLGSISSALAHDLVGPLSSLDHNLDRLAQLGESSRLAQRIVSGQLGATDEVVALGEMVEELAQIAEESKRSCALLLQMVDSIRDFGRPIAPSDAPACEPRAVVRQVLLLVRDLASRRRARVVYEGAAELPQARIARVELTQILLNLMINSTQAIQPRGQTGTVVLTAGATPTHVTFAVTDDGAGIPIELIAKVGTPFFTTRPDGSGLGYAQCLRLVGRAGGTITLESREGKGTAVTFEIPRADLAVVRPGS